MWLDVVVNWTLIEWKSLNISVTFNKTLGQHCNIILNWSDMSQNWLHLII